jgi:hypothetical protein
MPPWASEERNMFPNLSYLNITPPIAKGGNESKGVRLKDDRVITKLKRNIYVIGRPGLQKALYRIIVPNRCRKEEVLVGLEDSHGFR